MKEGLLYLKRNTADMTEKQWIVNKEDQMKVILSCHDGKLGELTICACSCDTGTRNLFY